MRSAFGGRQCQRDGRRDAQHPAPLGSGGGSASGGRSYVCSRVRMPWRAVFT